MSASVSIKRRLIYAMRALTRTTHIYTTCLRGFRQAPSWTNAAAAAQLNEVYLASMCALCGGTLGSFSQILFYNLCISQIYQRTYGRVSAAAAAHRLRCLPNLYVLTSCTRDNVGTTTSAQNIYTIVHSVDLAAYIINATSSRRTMTHADRGIFEWINILRARSKLCVRCKR